MKIIITTLLIVFAGEFAFAYYDFCQSPQDYNTFPYLYDVRTEYWKDIPNYNKNKIEYNNIINERDLLCPMDGCTDDSSRNDMEKSKK